MGVVPDLNLVVLDFICGFLSIFWRYLTIGAACWGWVGWVRTPPAPSDTWHTLSHRVGLLGVAHPHNILNCAIYIYIIHPWVIWEGGRVGGPPPQKFILFYFFNIYC